MLKIMRKCDCCRLGLRDENGVYIVPMNFGIAEQDSDIKLYFHCAESGRKTDILRSDPNVVFEMDTGHSLAAGSTACSCTFLYQSIMGKGVASIIEDTEEKIFGLTCIMQHYGHENLCDFKHDYCVVQRKKMKYKNGCCRLCKHAGPNGCTTSNFTCKMFYCFL